MGFALWTDAGLAWAAGTSEYRAMGAAVVSDTDLFRTADFRPRVGQALPPATFVGHFASLGQINDYLTKRRKLPVQRAGVVP
jgi:hypothetical protein